MTHKIPTLKHITLLFIILFLIQCPVTACQNATKLNNYQSDISSTNENQDDENQDTHDVRLKHAQDNLKHAQDNLKHAQKNSINGKNHLNHCKYCYNHCNIVRCRPWQNCHYQTQEKITKAEENYKKALELISQSQNFYYNAEKNLKQAQAQNDLEEDFQQILNHLNNLNQEQDNLKQEQENNNIINAQ